MSKMVAVMSMSLDGYVADLNDGVAEVFDWYFNSGDVEFHTGGADPMTFKVSGPSAEHLRGLTSGLGAVLTGRRTFDVAGGWGGNHAWGPAFVLTHHIPAGWPRPNSTVHFVTDGIESAVKQAKAMPERWAPRRNPRRHRAGSSWFRSSTLRPPRRHASRPWQPDGDPGRRRYTPALPSTQGVVQPHTLSRPAVSFVSGDIHARRRQRRSPRVAGRLKRKSIQLNVGNQQ